MSFWTHPLEAVGRHYVRFSFQSPDSDLEKGIQSFSDFAGPDKPHTEDQSFPELWRPFFKSGWIRTAHHLPDTEQLPSGVKRLLEIADLSPETLNLSPGVISTTVRRTLFTLDTLYEALAKIQDLFAQLTASRKEVSSLTDQLALANSLVEEQATEIGTLSEQIASYAQAQADNNRTIEWYSNQLGAWQTLALLVPYAPQEPIAIGRALGEKINLSPFHQLLPADVTPATKPEDLADQIFKFLFEQYQVIYQSIPEEYRKGPLSSASHLRETIESLSKAIKRLSNHAMSDRPNRLTLIFEEGVTIDSLWSQLPEEIKEGKDVPTNPEELRSFIMSLLRTPLATTAGCQHPPQLAAALRDPLTQSWETSITRVVDLVDLEAPPPAPVASSEGSLWKASDLPEFEKIERYESYREQLVRTFSAYPEPRREHFGPALNRIVASWKNEEVRNVSAYWDMDLILVRPIRDAITQAPVFDPNTGHPLTIARSWIEIQEAFLEACDDKFKQVTLLEDNIKDLNRVHPKAGESPNVFLLRFEAAVAKRRSAERRSSLPIMTDAQVRERLVQVIPDHVRSALRASFAMQAPPRMLERLTYQQLKQPLINAWVYTPNPAPAPRPRTNEVSRRPQGGRPAPVQQDAQVRTRRCGLNCSYDNPAPAVPNELRGAIYHSDRNGDSVNAAAADRNQRCIRAGVCESCRRPRNAHQSGQVFQTIRPFAQNLRALPAPRQPYLIDLPAPAGPRIEDVTDAASTTSHGQ